MLAGCSATAPLVLPFFGLRSTGPARSRAIQAAEKLEAPPASELRVAVVGAGPVGLMAAIALARRGYKRIRVYDRLGQPPAPESAAWGDPERSYNLGIGGRGQRALAKFGAFERVDHWSQTVAGRKDWPEAGPPVVTKNNRRYQTKVIARDRLSSCLYEELRQKYPDVRVDFNVQCAEVTFANSGNVLLTLDTCRQQSEATGTAVQASDESCVVQEQDGPFKDIADLVIGADGVASAVRTAMTGAGAAVQHERFADRRPIVYRILSIPIPEGEAKDLNYSSRRAGITIEALPNKEGMLLGVILFKPSDERIAQLKTGSDAKALFQGIFPDWPTPLISDLEWDAFVRRRTRELPQFGFCGPELHCGTSAVLLGDAIHSVKPFFGLGLNSGFEDVAVLDECLEAAGGDLTKALPDYSKRRGPEATCLVQLQRRFDQPTDLRFALCFVLPIVLDTIFQRLLPKVFAPSILALCQDGELSFTAAARRKRRDRVGQAAILGAAAFAVCAAAAFAVRGALRLASVVLR